MCVDGLIGFVYGVCKGKGGNSEVSCGVVYVIWGKIFFCGVWVCVLGV